LDADTELFAAAACLRAAGAGGKAAKKNQKRAARRKATDAADGTLSAGWEQGSNAASESGHGDAASGFGASGAAGSVGGGSVDHASLMGTGRFITGVCGLSVVQFALLAMWLCLARCAVLREERYAACWYGMLHHR
jgi:hypothetical protein